MSCRPWRLVTMVLLVIERSLIGDVVVIRYFGRADRISGRRLAGLRPRRPRSVLMSRRHCGVRADERCRAVRYLDPQGRVERDVLLTWPATRPLARNDRATLEDLAAPDAPWLGSLQGASEALDAYGALTAQRLGQLQLRGNVREPQVRVELAAGHLRNHLDTEVEWCQRQTHPRSPLFRTLRSFGSCLVLLGPQMNEAADPGLRVPRPRGEPVGSFV